MKKFYTFLIIIIFLFLILYVCFLSKYNIKIGNEAIIKSSSDLSTNTQSQKYVSPISIEYLRNKEIKTDEIKIEETLDPGSNYSRYIASYQSEGNKVYGLLTIPTTTAPTGGYPAIVFNHGYIPPSQYVTTKGYVAYVDYLAKKGFVVFKIDFRGHGKSEGDASGSYFSSAYAIDALSAVHALGKYENVNPNRIGMWGHSMAGNVVLRSLLISDSIKAAVIWAGAVYSYKDFASYSISDSSYARRPTPTPSGTAQNNRETSEEIQKIRSDPKSINFETDFWNSISLTKNIKYLLVPMQIHHAIDDNVVNINYSRDLVTVLKENGKNYEFYEYETGGHNINSPAFDTAIKRTAEFFAKNL